VLRSIESRQKRTTLTIAPANLRIPNFCCDPQESTQKRHPTILYANRVVAYINIIQTILIIPPVLSVIGPSRVLRQRAVKLHPQKQEYSPLQVFLGTTQESLQR
jgi:hypothetical protein